MLRGPLPQVLVILVLLHGFECRDRRTVRVGLGISGVVLVYAAGFRVDDAIGWWLLALDGVLRDVRRLGWRCRPVVGPRVSVRQCNGRSAARALLRRAAIGRRSVWRPRSPCWQWCRSRTGRRG